MSATLTTGRVLSHAPDELTRERLRPLGEGIGKVVYASRSWVVKRERHPSETLALILLWKALRALDRFVPGSLGRRLMNRPANQIRYLRLLFQAIVVALPRGLWLTTHARQMWRTYTYRAARGQRLERKVLSGTSLVPERVTFPPTRVNVARWPGWLVVSEATERVETTLDQRINELARAMRFDEIEVWLNRFLDLRTAGWQLGLFSLDCHLENFGVTADRVVLLDSGGLTNRWADIERYFANADDFLKPHVALGLEMTLRDRPDIADRFDARWREMVNPAGIREQWGRTPVLRRASTPAPSVNRTAAPTPDRSARRAATACTPPAGPSRTESPRQQRKSADHAG